MDTNWFFSTIAQSSAAIIGLVGAILISKLIDRSNSLQEDRTNSQIEIYNGVLSLVSSINVLHLPQDVSKDDKALLIGRNADIGRDFGKLIEYHNKKKNLVIDVRFQSPLSLNNHGLTVCHQRYQTYNAKLLPWSFYFVYFILISITVTGLFIPIYHLSGFDKDIAIYFIVAVSCFFLWFGWQLYDFWNTNRIKIPKI